MAKRPEQGEGQEDVREDAELTTVTISCSTMMAGARKEHGERRPGWGGRRRFAPTAPSRLDSVVGDEEGGETEHLARLDVSGDAGDGSGHDGGAAAGANLRVRVRVFTCDEKREGRGGRVKSRASWAVLHHGGHGFPRVGAAAWSAGRHGRWPCRHSGGRG